MNNAPQISIRLLLFICLAMICAELSGCVEARNVESGRRYDLKGKIVSIDKSAHRVVIAHDDIQGLMEGMTMPFALKDEWAFDVMSPGDTIQATLVLNNNRSWLENPVITRSGPMKSDKEATAGSAAPQPGIEVPDFSLINQDHKRIHLQQYRGRMLLITFIYTRCPLPEYCPLMSTNFAEIDRTLQNDLKLYAKTHLLSISVDPAYDTPKVLRSYGAAQTGKYEQETFQHWEFATAQPDEIRQMAQFFGLSYYQESDQIVHSLRTALISPDGRIFKIYQGNEWKPAEVLRDMQSLLDVYLQQ